MDSTILRIYMTISAKRKGPMSFWQKIFNSSLAGYLVKEAKDFGIEQSTYQRLLGGYLKGKKLAFDIGEVAPPDLPQCVELIDSPEKLNSFVNKYQDQMKDCRLVLFKSATLLQ